MSEHTTEVTTDQAPDQAPAELSQEAWDAQLEAGQAEMNRITANATQRDWLQITTRLGRTRDQIGADSGLTMLAVAWLKLKEAHGGADWNKLLDSTDADLEKIHDLPPGSRPA